MLTVFYDLETSDKNPIGQILNYCFILVDEKYSILDELSGLIRLTRLQLPDPGAVLANRIDVIEHQKVAVDEEPAALEKIKQFLDGAIQRAGGAVSFAGYNSSRFDLNFLRTSFIRNGWNPYFGGKLVPRDLLHVVHKAYVSSKDFTARVVQARSGTGKLSLSLQTVSQALELLKGAQAHESREDVLLTIEVAAWLRDNCGLDISTFDAYEGAKLHSTARSGTVYMVEEADYDLPEGSTKQIVPAQRPVTLLDADHRSALWVDLERYSEKPDPRAIMWRSATKHHFFTTGRAQPDAHLQRIARSALQQFKGVTIRNYFTPTSCDIEQDIYRLDFDGLDALCKAMRTNEKAHLDGLKGPEGKVLWTRSRLALPAAQVSDPRFAEMLRKYAIHRYGGTLQLARTVDVKAEEWRSRRGDGDSEAFHATFSDLVTRIRRHQDAAITTGKSDDLQLMNSLESYYRSSDIFRVAGGELFPEWSSKAA